MKSKPSDLIAIDEVIKLLRTSFKLKKLSRASIYQWIKTRGLPQPLAFGIPRQWRRIEIEAWIQQQIDGK
jgi:predicted DNA-binding transcriptional regulator AlpA